MVDSFDDDSWRDQPDKPKQGKPPLRVVTHDPRPDILCGSAVHETTDAMATALRGDGELYQRAGSLAHVIRTTPEDQIPGADADSPIIRGAPLSWLTNRVSRIARCVKRVNRKTGPVFVAVPPPSLCVRSVLEAGEWRGIRQLRGVIETPAMRPDGSIIQTPGYDAATGYLYEPNAEFRAVDPAPTQSACVLAFTKLAEPFLDFPFVSPAHLSAAVAAILTLLARPAILGAVPCWVFDASAPRSGKSLQVDVIALIATGRAASRMTYPENDEELEKVLAGYAMRGSTMVPFDNIARPFGGAALDKVITAVDKVDLRVLGSNDLRTLDWRAVVIGSGNNISFRGDMAKRVLGPRLETRLDDPETRTDLRYPDLRGWVRDNRVDLVHAGLTLLRGYVAADRPLTDCPRWGGFEDWARLIPHALRWVGAVDPMDARRGLKGDSDPESLAHAGMVEGWARLCAGLSKPEGLTVKQAISHLYPAKQDQGPPDGFDDLREIIESATNAKPGYAPSTRAMGERLRKWKDNPVNGARLLGTPATAGTVRWRVASV